MEPTSPQSRPRRVEQRTRVVIRFAGDSGDGMQITGDRFTATAAAAGNDLNTLPDFPAEIRAPAGTLPGVSAFQINFSSEDIQTPGDEPDVLVAMNPAALKVNIKDLKKNGVLIVNTDAFDARDLEKAHYATNPLEDHSLEAYRVFPVALEKLTKEALKETKLSSKDVSRCKNFFALGMMYWLYNRPLEHTQHWIQDKFVKKPEYVEANILALRGGYAYCEATELFQESYEVAPAKLTPGKYRNIHGNSALAIGLVTAARKANLPLFLGSYPITPASDVLHELSRYKHYGVMTFQAEDEIAAVGAAIGAAFGGSLAVSTTSGPGLALKAEAMGLAVMTELPLVVIDVQRGGPSTGLPTKTEQADLLLAMYGRHGEAPLPIVAARSPSHCFAAAFEAARLAVKYRTPVILLTDGSLANGAEPWLLPDVDALPDISTPFASGPNYTATDGTEEFWPYLRDPETLARPWAIPGTVGLEHRIGGIEKQDGTGNINYEPENHELMTELRARKIAGIADDIDPVEVDDPDGAELLVLGWGSTWGVAQQAVRQARERGRAVAHAHLVHLNPFPSNLGDVLARYDRVLVPEMNLGQLSRLVRAEFLVDAKSLTKVQGLPFRAAEVEAAIEEMLQ